MKKAIQFIVLVLFSATCIAGTYGGGAGTAASPYLIADSGDFEEIGATAADWGKYFKVTADIDFTGAGEIAKIGTTAANFTGQFDGNWHVFSNVDVDDTPDATNHTAMFNVCGSGAVIKNLTVIGATVDGSTPNAGQCYTAILVGENAYGATIDNCNVNGTVNHTGINDTKYVCYGMIAGANHGAVTNCIASGTMTLVSAAGGADTYAHVGGLVGYQVGGSSASQIGYTLNGYSTTTIVVTSPAVVAGVGGIVGDLYGSSTNVNYVKNCHYRGTISYTNDTGSGTGSIGGIAGNVGAATLSSTLSHCSSVGTINTVNTNGSYLYLGGGVGQLYYNTSGTNTVTYCFADMDITVDWGDFVRAGGFMGQSSASTVLTNCYSKGSCKDLDSDPTSTLTFQNAGTPTNCCYGGFIGTANGNISNCFCIMDTFAIGAGATYVKAFGGILNGTETACFWDSTTCGFTTANADAAAKTTAEMQTAGTFSAYSFASGTDMYWSMQGYPILQYPYSGGAGTSYSPWQIETDVDWYFAFSNTYGRTTNEYFTVADSVKQGLMNFDGRGRKTGPLGTMTNDMLGNQQ